MKLGFINIFFSGLILFLFFIVGNSVLFYVKKSCQVFPDNEPLKKREVALK